MLEKIIEQKLTMVVKKAGGIAVKFVSPSFDGMPTALYYYLMSLSLLWN